MAAVLNQIVENKSTQHSSVPYKKVCSRASCLRKLNKPSIVFLRYFYIRRCSFSRAIYWCHKIYGEPPFWGRKARNTLKKCEKSKYFSVKKYLFVYIIIFVKSPKRHGPIRKIMLFLFARVITMWMLEIAEWFCTTLKVQKMIIFCLGL